MLGTHSGGVGEFNHFERLWQYLGIEMLRLSSVSFIPNFGAPALALKSLARHCLWPKNSVIYMKLIDSLNILFILQK